jgi:hypothetical protein
MPPKKSNAHKALANRKKGKKTTAGSMYMMGTANMGHAQQRLAKLASPVKVVNMNALIKRMRQMNAAAASMRPTIKRMLNK